VCGRGKENVAGRRFVFVDRDGTLILDHGYMHEIREYDPLPAAIEGLRRLQEAGFGIVIITNQSGIGRGYYTEDDFRAFQDHLVRDFAAKGVRIDASYHCPHAPEAECACRKPATALLERARKELGASLPDSFVVGDRASDIEMGRAAGCQAILVLTGWGREARAEIPPGVPVADDLLDAARQILGSGEPGS
jgi:D-glycero-D-manno-heptose 1,7-bisphosphate phosphatase